MALIIPKRLELNIHYFICELTPILTTTSMINNNIDGAERYNSVFFVQFFFRFLEPWQWLASWSRDGMLGTLNPTEQEVPKNCVEIWTESISAFGNFWTIQKTNRTVFLQKKLSGFCHRGRGIFSFPDTGALNKANHRRQEMEQRASEKTTWNGGGTS